MAEEDSGRVHHLEQRVHELEVTVQQLAELGGAAGTLLRLATSFTPPIKLKPADDAQGVLPVLGEVGVVTPKVPHYVNSEWRTYAGFRRNMQRREQIARDNMKANGRVQEISKELLAKQQGGDSVRNISRVMVHYGLDPETHWPPSTWPEEQPHGAAKHPRARDIYTLVAAAMLPAVPLLFDVVSDGRLNHAVRLLGCAFAKALG